MNNFRDGIFLLLFLPHLLHSANLAPQVQPLPTLREQAAEMKDWISYRENFILPALMEKHGVDVWLMSMKEYTEDLVFFSVAQEYQFHARRRTVVIFTRYSEDEQPKVNRTDIIGW